MARRKQNKEGWTLHFIEDHNFDECPYCNNFPHVHDLASAKRLYTHIDNHGLMKDGSPWSAGQKANLLEGFEYIWNPDCDTWDDLKSYYEKPGGGWHGPYGYEDHHPDTSYEGAVVGAKGIVGSVPVNPKTGRPLSTKSKKSKPKPKARKTKRKTTRKKPASKPKARKTTRKKTAKKKKGRKSPTISATKRKIGTRMRGNDGKMWEVKKAGKSQRWMAGAEYQDMMCCFQPMEFYEDGNYFYCPVCEESIKTTEFDAEVIGNNMPSKYNPYDYVADAPFGAEEGESCPVCGCSTLLLDNIEVEGEDFSLIVCDNCEWFEELDYEPEGVPEYEDPLEEWMELGAQDSALVSRYKMDDTFYRSNTAKVLSVAAILGLLFWKR